MPRLRWAQELKERMSGQDFNCPPPHPSSALTRAIAFYLLEFTVRFHVYKVQLLKRQQKPCAQDQVLTLSMGTPGITWSSLSLLVLPPEACMTQAPRPGYSEGVHE